jgi:HdeA/HdeB family
MDRKGADEVKSRSHAIPGEKKCADIGRSFLTRLQNRLVRRLTWRVATQFRQHNRKVIHLAEVTCRTFTELTQQEQGIIMAWLQAYYLPEQEPAVIDVEKLLSDKAKLTEHCINKPEDDVMTAAEAVME